MTYLELMQSAVNNAMRGMSPEQSVAVDAVAIADTLFPIVSQGVCETAAANEYTRSLVMRTKTITLAAGTATLTDDVLTHYFMDSTLLNLSNLNFHYAARDYADFVRRGDRRLGIYCIKQDRTIQVIDPNQSFAAVLTATGARSLNIPCVVIKPATATTDVDCSPEILSNLDEALANALRGEIIRQAAEAA